MNIFISDGYAFVCDIYTLCYIFKCKTGGVIKLAQFEERNVWSETHEKVEISDESDDNSIMPPLLSQEEMNAMDSVN